MTLKLTKKLTLSIVLAAAGMASQGNAEPSVSSDWIGDYIFSVRVSYASCSQASTTEIVKRKLREMTGGDSAFDFSKATNCRKDMGAEVSEKFKIAQKFSGKNKLLAEEIMKLQEYWSIAMTSSLTPNGSDTERSFERKVRDTNNELKEKASKLISVFCKGDFSCVEDKNDRFARLDEVI